LRNYRRAYAWTRARKRLKEQKCNCDSSTTRAARLQVMPRTPHFVAKRWLPGTHAGKVHSRPLFPYQITMTMPFSLAMAHQRIWNRRGLI
jgi:hypothetical protein